MGILRVTNQSDLARELGTKRQTVKYWLNDDKYAEKRPPKEPNGTYLVGKYREWMHFHGLVGRGNMEPKRSEGQRLRDRLTKIKVQQEEAKLKKMRAELVEKAEVVEALGKGMAYLYRELDRVFGNEVPPRTRGLTEKQMSALMREEVRKIFIEAKKRFAEGVLEDT